MTEKNKNIDDGLYTLEINLWRGQKQEESGQPILYPILNPFSLSNGKKRDPDIRTYKKNGAQWIDSKSGGVPLFDKLGVPNKKWLYYRLNIGTNMPKGLFITKDGLNRKHKSYHYSIKLAWDMPLKKFLMLLDKLSVNFITEV